MATTPAFLLNATTIDFDSVASMEDAAIIFKKIAESGLQSFFSLESQDILATVLLSVFE